MSSSVARLFQSSRSTAFTTRHSTSPKKRPGSPSTTASMRVPPPDSLSTFFVERPIEEVFDYLTDLERVPEWQTNVLFLQLQDPGETPACRRKFSGQKTRGSRSSPTEFESS